MGTRHLIAVISGGTHKIAQYGQWDGYPDGQGIDVLAFCKDEEKMGRLKSNLPKLKYIDQDQLSKLWEGFGVSKGQDMVSMDVGKKFHIKHPQFSRDMGSDILGYVADFTGNELLLKDTYSFGADSLFCEWAYVIDIDAGVLEVYKGFNQTRLDKTDRFYPQQQEHIKKSAEREAKIKAEGRWSPQSHDPYYGVKLEKAYPLLDLPSKEQFLDDLKEHEEA